MNKTKIIPYIEKFEEWSNSYHPLNPTGKWKYVTNEHYKNKIFVEHKGIFFKKWVSEDSIVFCNERSEEIKTCKENL